MYPVYKEDGIYVDIDGREIACTSDEEVDEIMDIVRESWL